MLAIKDASFGSFRTCTFHYIESVSYVIDPKAISKDALYDTLNPTTREWVDCLFTHFDGDVDP